MRKFLLTATLVACSIAAGCSSTLQDLEGIEADEPEKIEVFQSPDGFPNVMRVCIDGVAFAITTREYEPVQPVAGWESWCP